MSYRVLYYPGFNPSKSWLRGMLLLSDQVVRIIPEDADHEDPEYVSRLADALPGSVQRISPTFEDTLIDNINIDRLERALHIASRGIDPRRLSITIGRHATTSIEGYTFLHLSKLSEDVKQLLERSPVVHRWDSESRYLITPKAISGLILSYVANQISRRTGLHTVTNQPLPFTVSALDALNVTRVGAVHGALFSGILKLQIPSGISHLDDDVYLALHERYRGIRKQLRRVIANISQEANLEAIEDPTELRARVSEELKQFVEEGERLRQDRWMDRFRTYIPLSIATLISLCAEFAEAREVAVGSALGGFVIQLVQPLIQRNPLLPEQQTQRLLADLRADILRRRLIPTLT